MSGALESRDPIVERSRFRVLVKMQAVVKPVAAVDCRGDEVAGEPGDAGESAGGKW